MDELHIIFLVIIVSILLLSDSILKYFVERQKIKNYTITLLSYQAAYLIVVNTIQKYYIAIRSKSTSELEDMVIFLGTELSNIIENYKPFVSEDELNFILDKINSYDSDNNSMTSIVNNLIKSSIDDNTDD